MNEPAAGSDDARADEQPFRDGAVVRDLHHLQQKGLHARASAKFVQTVEKFDADVRVMRCGERPSAAPRSWA